MNRRTLLTLLLVLAQAGSLPWSVQPALADDDSEDESDDGGDDSGDDDSSDDGEDDDDGVDDDGGDDDDSPQAVPATSGSGGRDDQDDALRAVRAKDALPLRQLFEQFDRQLQGTVVDVTLIRNTDALRYRVKFIDPSGRVRRAYFDAVTGALIR